MAFAAEAQCENDATALARAGASVCPPPATAGARSIRNGEALFSPGDPRRGAYRLTTGALCHYMVWPDGSHDVIEFAFPGDIVGFGHLSEHVSTAQAMVDTTVALLSEAELDQALEQDAALAARMASAADREFDFLRRRALGTGQPRPLTRVASYILALADMACRSGDGLLQPAPSAGAGSSPASMLEMPPAEFAAAVAELEQRGLIKSDRGAFVVCNRPGLEAIASD
jgi:CRP/FNR family transcriptional regulator